MNKWNPVTLLESKMVADGVMSLVFDAPWWPGHRAGQHVDVRLTAPNGYQAQRSYSIANAPEDVGKVELGVQLLDTGEVSPFLFDLKPGDQIEMRGPLGGHFIWNTSMSGPLVLIGGGSGCVPMMSMLRHHERHILGDKDREVYFLISSKTIGRVLYKDELESFSKEDSNFHLTLTLTEKPPLGWVGYTKRVDREMIFELFGGLLSSMPMFYICGPTLFVEAVAGALVAAGFNPHLIKTERFG
jgi:ferredoxin-NADP reductase